MLGKPDNAITKIMNSKCCCVILKCNQLSCHFQNDPQLKEISGHKSFAEQQQVNIYVKTVLLEKSSKGNQIKSTYIPPLLQLQYCIPKALIYTKRTHYVHAS